jgi:CheY-like chemotaxis protein
VLPLAERLLTEADWAELDAAFMQNRDPLTYRDGEDEFRPLFKRILMTLPAPIGLGPAMEALHASHPTGGERRAFRVGRARSRRCGWCQFRLLIRCPSRDQRRTKPFHPVNAAVHIAVLDDEAEITTLLANYLQGQGFRVSQAHNGATLLRLMAADPPQLVLLDLGLPGEDGFSIARQLREHWQCGLVIVTGRGDSIDKVVGLEVGADDYVTKPFDLRELLARIRAVLRRTTGTAPIVPAAAQRKRLPIRAIGSSTCPRAGLSIRRARRSR